MSSPEGNKENGPRFDNHAKNTKNEEDARPETAMRREHNINKENNVVVKDGVAVAVDRPSNRNRRRSDSRSPSRGRRRDQHRPSRRRSNSRSRSRSPRDHYSRSSRSRSTRGRNYEDDRNRDEGRYRYEEGRGRYYHDENERAHGRGEERYRSQGRGREESLDYYYDDRRRMPDDHSRREDRRDRHSMSPSFADRRSIRDNPREDRRWEEPSSTSHRNNNGNNDNRNRRYQKQHKKPFPEYQVVQTPKDQRLGDVHDDPRGEDPTQRITKKASSRGNGRNTESFDPASTLVRPDLRIHVGSSRSQMLDRLPLKHDDVVIVPELFGPHDDWSMYYQLVQEMRDIQAKGDVKGSEWISWHEGAHLICKNPTGSPTFTKIIDRLCDYFQIRKESIGTRFNWYHDSSDWKPFHHDSAAFNPQRAKNQNITVGVSFGATRELAFIRAEPLKNDDKVRLYFPQTNNGVFSFGRDANILWKHGVNAMLPSEQDGKGRISIVLWGLAENILEEEGSPPLLGSDGQGPHSNGGGNHKKKRHNNRRGSRGGAGGGGNGGGVGGGGGARQDQGNRRNDDRRGGEERGERNGNGRR